MHLEMINFSIDSLYQNLFTPDAYNVAVPATIASTISRRVLLDQNFFALRSSIFRTRVLEGKGRLTIPYPKFACAVPCIAIP